MASEEPSPRPDDGQAVRRASPTVAFDKALDNILKLGTHDLAIEEEAVVIVDRRKKEQGRRRTCGVSLSGFGSATRSIPLYNVLWAEVATRDDDTTSALVIDFAEAASGARLRAARLSIPLPKGGIGGGDDDTDDGLAPGAVEAWAEALLSRSYGAVPRRRRAYVLVNPRAGPGGADRKWDTQARPLLEAARMRLTVVTTQYSGQAAELCAQLDADAYDVVVACSGDGLPHEVFNGLGRRPDARRVLGRLAVGHIPCGSGNAMSCNLYGTHRPSLAALALVKGVATPLDLVSVTHGDCRTLSFLSQALGILAEADLATEHLRWMGGARFTWGLLERLLAKKVYPCDLAVKVEIDHKHGVKEHYSRAQQPEQQPGQQPEQQQQQQQQTQATDSDGGDDHQAVATATGSRSLAGTNEETASSSADDDEAAETGEGLPPLRYGTVNDKLPDGWEMIPHEKMGNFYCGNMAYVALDTEIFSAALINDGLMDLVTIDGDVSPLETIRMMLSVEGGHFFDDPLVKYRKISAFRIIPRSPSGYISIDGERIPWGPFQAEIHRGLGLVLTRSGSYQAPGPKNWDKVTVAERLMA